MSAEDSKLKSKGHGGGEWNHTIMTEEGGTLPAVRDTTVISGKSHAKVSTRKEGGFPLPLPLLFPLFSFPFFFVLLYIDTSDANVSQYSLVASLYLCFVVCSTPVRLQNSQHI